ncbi:hypothetical protein VTK26DRAFT_7170 [Humicola hyalothermophila]
MLWSSSSHQTGDKLKERRAMICHQKGSGQKNGSGSLSTIPPLAKSSTNIQLGSVIQVSHLYRISRSNCTCNRHHSPSTSTLDSLLLHPVHTLSRPRTPADQC